MKTGNIIRLSKRMVIEYINRYVKKTKDDEKATYKDVHIIGFHDEPEDHRVLIYSPITDDLYYEVTCDKDTDEMHSYIYRRVRKKFNGEENRKKRSVRNYR